MQTSQKSLTTKYQDLSTAWFKELQTNIISAFEKIESEATPTATAQNAASFTYNQWSRGENGGGGTAGVIKDGRVFEKGGVNFSIVHGQFSDEFAKTIPYTTPSKEFWASGLSLVTHMQSPLVPAIHMNTRMIVTGKAWFAGGIDMTPMINEMNEEDTAMLHNELKKLCDRHDPTYYQKFKQQCDDYFFIKHRNEPRGIGGIFYDYLTDDLEKHFAFTVDVGETFLKIYPQIVKRNLSRTWTAAEREKQLYKRGRYTEFNLMYDRGTLFGLKTNGNVDAILMSLPPLAKW